MKMKHEHKKHGGKVPMKKHKAKGGEVEKDEEPKVDTPAFVLGEKAKTRMDRKGGGKCK